MASHKQEPHLLIAFVSLVTPLALYLCRSLDDNRLTSWQWVFGAVDPGPLFLILLAITPLLWLLALRPPLAGRPLFLIPASFLAALFFLDIPEVIVDASRYFVQAKLLKEYGIGYFCREWGREVFAWTDLPLMSFLYGLLFTLFGEGRLAVQLLNAVLFALTTFLTYILGRELWDEEVGLYGGLLLLGFPYLYTQVPLMLVDVGTMFFLMLAMVTLHRAMTRGGAGRIGLASLALAALFLVKYSAWLLLTALVPVFFCSLGGDWRLATRRGLLIALPALLAISLALVAHREVVIGQLELLTLYQKPGLKRWGESLASTFFFQTHPLLTAGLLYSGWRAWRRRDVRYLAAGYLILLLLAALEIRRIRYSLPIFPLIALLAAYGFRDISNREARRHLALAIVASSLLLARGAFLPFLQGMGERNLQEAGQYLNGLEGEQVKVLVLSEPEPVLDPRVTVPLLDLFTAKQLIYQPQPMAGERPEWVAESPLRFTWEFPIPAFYLRKEQAQPAAVVVISNSSEAGLPPWLRENTGGLIPGKRFIRDNKVFQNRTSVVVYEQKAAKE